VGGQQFGAGLVRPRSEPTPPELVREVWAGVEDIVVADARGPRFALAGSTDDYKAGATVKLRLFRARCDKRPRRWDVARTRVKPNGKVGFRFRLPRLRRGEEAAVFTSDSNLSGSRLIVPRRADEPNLALVRTPRGAKLVRTLAGCA
jgi:hypothetical protein